LNSRSFARQATISAHTLRPPAVASGLRGEPVPYLSAITCTPLDPVDMEARQRMGLEGSARLLQVFVDGGIEPDIRANDRLVVAGIEYPVRAVEPWRWPPTSDKHFVRVVVEDKRPVG